MDESNSLMPVSGDYKPVSLEAVKAHRQHVLDIIDQAMVEGVHVGAIPGCDKKALLQPGAESLAFAFRLEFGTPIETVTDLGNDHREYDCKLPILVRGSGVQVGCGIGTCSTKEKKYRYRTEVLNSGDFDEQRRPIPLPVPEEWWTTKDTQFLGGPNCQVQKRYGKWVIVRSIDHPDPADYWNTCRRISYKRAQVHGVRTLLSLSEKLTDQDGAEAIMAEQAGAEAAAPPTAPQSRKATKTKPKTAAKTTKKAPPADALKEWTGKIAKVEPKRGAKGDYHSVTAVDGTWFSCFHESVAETLKAFAGSDMIMMIHYVQNGTYKNIENAEKVD